MRTIIFYNRKGGVGKTSTAINVAGCLDKYHHKKVLVVDCDTQHNTTDCFREEGVEIKSLYDYFVGDVKDAHEIIYPVHFAEKKKSNIFFIPSVKEIDSLELKDNYALKKLLDSVDEEFDYCLIDVTPALMPLTYQGFCASRYVITVSELATDSILGYSLLIDEINSVKENGYNDTLQTLGMVANKYEKRKSLQNTLLSALREGAGDSMFDSVINLSATVDQARFFGLPTCYYESWSDATKKYMELTDEIVKRIGDRK